MANVEQLPMNFNYLIDLLIKMKITYINKIHLLFIKYKSYYKLALLTNLFFSIGGGEMHNESSWFTGDFFAHFFF